MKNMNKLEEEEKMGKSVKTEFDFLTHVQTQMAKGARGLLKGLIVSQEVRKNTPKRCGHAWQEMLSGYSQDPYKILTTFPTEGYTGRITVDTNFFSVCEHHLLPFFGGVKLEYTPGKKIVGLSKVPRLVKCLARRLQIQERLTSEILDAFCAVVQPEWAEVTITGQHLCCSGRGVATPSTMTTQAAFYGDPSSSKEEK